MQGRGLQLAFNDDIVTPSAERLVVTDEQLAIDKRTFTSLHTTIHQSSVSMVSN